MKLTTNINNFKNETVIFKGNKYNIDDEKTAKNLTLMQEIEIDKLNKLIEDYKILLNKAEKKLEYVEELDRNKYLHILKLQNRIKDLL